MKIMIDLGQSEPADDDELIDVVSRALAGEHELDSGETIDLGKYVVSVIESEGQKVPPGSFSSWIKRQSDRDDVVGDLARDVVRDEGAPKGRASKGQWIAHLRPRGRHVIDAFKDAWLEFSEQEAKAGPRRKETGR